MVSLSKEKLVKEFSLEAIEEIKSDMIQKNTLLADQEIIYNILTSDYEEAKKSYLDYYQLLEDAENKTTIDYSQQNSFILSAAEKADLLQNNSREIYVVVTALIGIVLGGLIVLVWNFLKEIRLLNKGA